MKAITIWQPWASLAELREKKIETRSWATSYRGPLLIHSAKGAPVYCETLANLDKQFNNALTGSKEWNPDIWDTLPFGSVIAICNLVDCLKIKSLDKADGVPVFARLENGQDISGNELVFGDYTPGRYAWKLEDVHRLIMPIQARGRQSLWNWNETEHMVAIDPYKVGPTKIWTPKGVRSGRIIDRPDEDAVFGLEVAV